MSSIVSLPTKLQPIYPPPSSSSSSSSPVEPPTTQSLISALNLQRHIEGGYFAELDRNPLLIPNPFLDEDEEGVKTAETPLSGDNKVRNASTSIYYLLTKAEPQGHFHRNRGRTVSFSFFLRFVLTTTLLLFDLCFLRVWEASC